MSVGLIIFLFRGPRRCTYKRKRYNYDIHYADICNECEISVNRITNKLLFSIQQRFSIYVSETAIFVIQGV